MLHSDMACLVSSDIIAWGSMAEVMLEIWDLFWIVSFRGINGAL